MKPLLITVGSPAQPLGFGTLPVDDDWTPPERLLRFLDGGEPPVYVGFGSMIGRNAGPLTDVVIDGMLVIDEVPHDWLLPRAAAAVHHGGIGTVGAALIKDENGLARAVAHITASGAS